MSKTLPKPKKNEYLVQLTITWNVIVPAKEDGSARTPEEAKAFALDMDPMDVDSQTGGPDDQEAEIVDDDTDGQFDEGEFEEKDDEDEG